MKWNEKKREGKKHSLQTHWSRGRVTLSTSNFSNNSLTEMQKCLVSCVRSSVWRRYEALFLHCIFFLSHFIRCSNELGLHKCENATDCSQVSHMMAVRRWWRRRRRPKERLLESKWLVDGETNGSGWREKERKKMIICNNTNNRQGNRQTGQPAGQPRKKKYQKDGRNLASIKRLNKRQSMRPCDMCTVLDCVRDSVLGTHQMISFYFLLLISVYFGSNP